LFSIVFLPPFSVVKTFFVIPVACVEECLLQFEERSNPRSDLQRANSKRLALWYGKTKNGKREREERAEGKQRKKMQNEMRSSSTESFSASIGAHES